MNVLGINKKGFTLTGNYLIDAILLLLFIITSYLIIRAVFNNIRLPWF